jgi:IS30 family transposase
VTSDNGKKFAGHGLIDEITDCQSDFAYSYSSWERGRRVAKTRTGSFANTCRRKPTLIKLQKLQSKLDQRAEKRLNNTISEEIFLNN